MTDARHTRRHPGHPSHTTALLDQDWTPPRPLVLRKGIREDSRGNSSARTAAYVGFQGRMGTLMRSPHRSFPIDPRSALSSTALVSQWSALTPQPEDVRGKWSVRGDCSASRTSLLWMWLFTAAALIITVPPALAIEVNPSARSTLTLVERTVTQDQGTWVVDYRLRHTGHTGVIIAPEEIAVKVEGWVSNSRVASHTMPRWSSLVVSRGVELPAVADVIAAADELHKCRERLLVSVWTEDQALPRHSPNPSMPNGPGGKAGAPASISREPGSSLPISLSPAAIVHFRLCLEHQHILYGDYDPLLAVRTIALTLGSAVVRDVVPLDREQYLAQPQFVWPDPPKDRRDTHHAVSGPDSLHLEADVPGHQYYRYPERPVRYNTKMRLRFWYLIAAGTEGECSVRLAQTMDTPISWRPLHSGRYEECLKTIGRWTKVERIIQTDPEATVVALEFKIFGENEIGEMWIDDVSLEPVIEAGPGGP
jgi:hypothetical protein